MRLPESLIVLQNDKNGEYPCVLSVPMWQRRLLDIGFNRSKNVGTAGQRLIGQGLHSHQLDLTSPIWEKVRMICPVEPQSTNVLVLALLSKVNGAVSDNMFVLAPN